MAMHQAGQAFIIAARRTAIGRIGGLHSRRRLETLAAPVIEAILKDAGVAPDQLDEIIVGNATAGGNPARLIALASGLPEHVNATTIDQQDASGLVAILHAARLVAGGDADAVIAGGAESLSTAPWRIARPRNAHQIPHFINPHPFADDVAGSPIAIEGSERLARQHNITRDRQDNFARASFERALAARKARQFAGEIVPIGARPEDARDQSTVAHDPVAFSEELPFIEDTGTLTPANTSVWHDGAAFVLVASAGLWSALGEPPALAVVANAAMGVTADREAQAPIAAVEKLYRRLNGFDRTGIGIVETSEASAAQAVALAEAMGLDEASINPQGGAIARGHPFGAAGAVLVVRLFSQLVRNCDSATPPFAVATQGAIGGLGVAALFTSVPRN